MELDKQIEKNINTLIDIRDSIETSPAVRIQAIQTMHKIIESVGAVNNTRNPSAANIMQSIRAKKTA